MKLKAMTLCFLATTLAGANGAGADVVYFDNTFSDANWGVQPAAVFAVGAGSGATSAQRLSGGNLFAHRRIQNTIGPNGAVFGFHMNSSATYDPAISGEITSINYSEDSINFTTIGGDGQAAGLAVRQGGRFYALRNPILVMPYADFSTWRPNGAAEIVASDLWEVTASASLDPGSHPDFSSHGAAMTLGYYRANSGSAPYSTECGIDNWNVRINNVDPNNIGNPAASSCNCAGGRPAFVDRLPSPPFKSGVVAVTTEEGDGPGMPVVRVWDLTPPLPSLSNGTSPGTYSHPSWTQANLGSVFGASFGKNGDIYVASTSIYSQDNVGTIGGNIGGKIYKLDGLTGAASLFCALPNALIPVTSCFNPNTGTQTHAAYPGIGQVSFDCGQNALFASNFEDGRIYRISSTGTVLSTFEHSTGTVLAGLPPADPPGFPPLNQTAGQRGSRVWAVQPGRGRLFYSVWREDIGFYTFSPGQPSSQVDNEIWSIQLSASGDFVAGTEQLEVMMSPFPALSIPCVPSVNTAYSGIASSPVSSIEFRPGCNCMLLAERSMQGDGCTDAHVSRVVEYCTDLGTFVPSPRVFNVPGNTFFIVPNSAAGGVAFDWTPGAKNSVWATADAIRASYFSPTPAPPCSTLISNPYVYGMTGISGNGSTTGFADIHVDFNNQFTQTKFTIGAVDVSCPTCSAPPANMNLWLPLDELSGTTASNTAMAAISGAYVGTANLTSVPGPVNRGQCFNQRSYIQVPDYPGISPGAGSFSVDLWIKNDAPATGNVGILDKRSGYTAAGPGYAVYIDNNSYPVLSLRDTAGKQYIAQGGGSSTLPIGVWEHIAFTVTRSGSSVPAVQCYRNGLPVGITPLASAPAPWGSLSGSGVAPLRIASPLVSGNPASAWKGCLDEIEIFTRALSASEIQNIAWRSKCKHGVYAPIKKPVCSYNTTIIVPVQVCNYSGAPTTYGYTLSPKPGCGSTVSPSSYSPPSGSITVASGFCGTINVTMPKPPFVSVGNTSCFEFCATPQGASGSAPICTTGTLQLASPIFCPRPLDPTSYPTRIPQFVSVPLTNLGDQPVSAQIRVRVLGPDGEPDSSMISLDDLLGQGALPPGETLLDDLLDLPAGAASGVEFEATFLGQDPIGLYTIVIEADLNGRGEFELVTTLEVRNTPPGAFCPADYNLDGNVDPDDLSDFIGGFFTFPQDPSVDYNGDGVIDPDDLSDYIGAFFSGC